MPSKKVLALLSKMNELNRVETELGGVPDVVLRLEQALKNQMMKLTDSELAFTREKEAAEYLSRQLSAAKNRDLELAKRHDEILEEIEKMVRS